MAWLIGVVLGLLVIALIYLLLPAAEWRALLRRLRRQERPAVPFASRKGAPTGVPAASGGAPGAALSGAAGERKVPAGERAARRGLLFTLGSALARWRAARGPAGEEGTAGIVRPQAPRQGGVSPHAAVSRARPGRGSESLAGTVPRRQKAVRTWQEESPAPPAPDRSRWAEEEGGRTLGRLAGTAKGPGPTAHPSAPPQPAAFRPGLIVLVVVIMSAALTLSLLPSTPQAPPPAPPRPHHLTIVLAGLGLQEDTVVVTPEVQAREMLRSVLQERLDSEGLGDLATLRSIETRPADATAAYSLTQESQVDLLLWGGQQEARPRSILTLTLAPHLDQEVPEFEEYLRLMVTPRHLPLSRPGTAGLDVADLKQALPWLAHFYLGEFDRIEARSPRAMPLPSMAAEVISFHWAGLMWFKGNYGEAEAEYRRLAGGMFVVALDEEPTAPTPSPAPTPLRAAAANNQAVVLLMRVELGQAGHEDVGQAISLLQAAVAADPEALPAQYNLGRAYLAQRRWEEAVRPLEEAVRRDGQHAPALVALSEAYRGVGDADKSRDYARQAIEVYAGLPEAHLALARYYLGLGNAGEAGKELDQALRLAEEQVRVRRSRLVALRGGPNPQVARAAFLEAWVQRGIPLLAQVHLSRANQLLLKGILEGPPDFFDYLWTLLTGEQDTLGKALGEVDQALSSHANWYEAYCLQGEIHWARRSNDQALDALQKAKALDPKDAEAYLSLARMHLERRMGTPEEELDQAEEQYHALIGLGVDPPRGYLGLGEIARQQGDWEKARAAFEEAVKTEPTFGEAYLRLGQVEYQLSRDQAALWALEKAVQNAGRQNWLRVAGRVEHGEILLEQYLQSKLDRTREEDLAAWAWADFEQARQDAGRVRNFPLRVSGVVILFAPQPQQGYEARALAGLGRVAFEQEKYAEAAAFYQEALKRDPWCFAAHYGLGRAYLVQGNSAAAVSELEKAVQVNARSISAWHFLREACYAQYREEDARSAGLRVEELCGQIDEQQQKWADDLEACIRNEQ